MTRHGSADLAQAPACLQHGTMKALQHDHKDVAQADIHAGHVNTDTAGPTTVVCSGLRAEC